MVGDPRGVELQAAEAEALELGEGPERAEGHVRDGRVGIPEVEHRKVGELREAAEARHPDLRHELAAAEVEVRQRAAQRCQRLEARVGYLQAPGDLQGTETGEAGQMAHPGVGDLHAPADVEAGQIRQPPRNEAQPVVRDVHALREVERRQLRHPRQRAQRMVIHAADNHAVVPAEVERRQGPQPLPNLHQPRRSHLLRDLAEVQRLELAEARAEGADLQPEGPEGGDGGASGLVPVGAREAHRGGVSGAQALKHECHHRLGQASPAGPVLQQGFLRETDAAARAGGVHGLQVWTGEGCIHLHRHVQVLPALGREPYNRLEP
mmetsp:Transcript_18847/g.45025  ORF Transcript_18847/g.45025 Transcript_18847/m.45025 type:complete len:322 (+) Transcript_18847:1625-2590(+)